MNEPVKINSGLPETRTSRGLKVVIAGGGTGGHIFPAIAIANALLKIDPRTEILFVGAKGKMEMEKIPEAGFPIEGITIAGFNRSSFIKNLSLPFKLIKSFFQVRNIFISWMPDLAIGVGGYSSFPVLRYAQARGIPTFIHEANSFAGKSNILLGKKATRIFVSTDGMESFFPAGKLTISGNPVRESILAAETGREESLNFFGLSSDKKTVLCIGGSLGAKTINEAIDRDLDFLESEGLQLIWQTGKSYLERAKERTAKKSFVFASEFINRMDLAYAAADLVISRAGAMSVAELAVVGKPVIFVPYPHAAEDHQTVNARKLEDRKAAILIPDAEAGTTLVKKAAELLKNEAQLKELSDNVNRLGVRNADELIAKEILNTVIL